MSLVANARMYSVAPGAAAAWRDLFEWVAGRARVDLVAIAHDYPLPLKELWARPDLGCAFMCGWPFAQSAPRPQPIAAPVPSPARYGGQAIYFTDFVVRATVDFRTLEDTFGGRLAYTAEDSHSGYNAPRYHLLGYRKPIRPALYRHVVGPYTTPRRVAEAVLAGEADVGPLDSYAHDLLRRHAPDLAVRLRVVATTAPAPIPPLIAAPACAADVVERLRAAWLSVAARPELAKLRDALQLKGFAAPDPDAYAVTRERARAAVAAGYATLG